MAKQGTIRCNRCNIRFNTVSALITYQDSLATPGPLGPVGKCHYEYTKSTTCHYSEKLDNILCCCCSVHHAAGEFAALQVAASCFTPSYAVAGNTRLLTVVRPGHWGLAGGGLAHLLLTVVRPAHWELTIAGLANSNPWAPAQHLMPRHIKPPDVMPYGTPPRGPRYDQTGGAVAAFQAAASCFSPSSAVNT
jgi:hypothetical protein